MYPAGEMIPLYMHQLKHMALGSLLVATFALPLATLASPLDRPISSTPSLTGGQHRYIVTFDGEGEATVAAQLTYINTTPQPITSVSLSFPRAPLSRLRALQQYTVKKEESVCKERTVQGVCII